MPGAAISLSLIHIYFFGKAQSEDAPQAPLAQAEEPAAKEDTMSLPLLPLDGEEPQQADVYKRQAVFGPKGLAVRQLKRYASWVQNVVRQFGPYLSWAQDI